MPGLPWARDKDGGRLDMTLSHVEGTFPRVWGRGLAGGLDTARTKQS